MPALPGAPRGVPPPNQTLSMAHPEDRERLTVGRADHGQSLLSQAAAATPGFTGGCYGERRCRGHLLTRFSMEHWNSLIFFKVSLSRFTSLMYMAKSWKLRQGQ